MTDAETVRVCPGCRAVSYPTDGHRSAVHFLGCPNPRPPETWRAAPELDRRPCLGQASFRALHSAWLDAVTYMPKPNRDRLPDRLLRPTFLELQDAILDGCLDVNLVTPDGITPHFALAVDTGQGIEVVRVPLTWIGADVDALVFEESLRMHLALARIREEDT